MILSAYFAQANWLHIIVAGIAYFLLGWLWFSLLFGKPWARLQERDMSKVDKGAAARSMGISFVANFALVITVGLFCYALGARTLLGGLKVGLALGLGISAVNYLNMFVFSGKKWPLFLIEAGYQVAGIVLAAVILSAW